MKKIIIFISIGVIGLSLKATAIDISVNTSLSKLSGQTEYELNVRGIDTLQGNLAVVRKLRSRLEFPLNSTLATFGVAFSSAGDSSKKWIISFDISRNLNDPTELMKDSDWDEIENFFPMTKFSYTESVPEMNFTELHFKSQYQVSGNLRNYRFILFGMKYQKIEQSIDNFTGWRRLFDEGSISYLPRDTIPQFTNLPALFYRVTYKSPYVGLGFHNSLGNSSSVEIEASYALVMATDFDNHLLRKKTSEASGNGNGIIIGAKGKFLLKNSRTGKNVYLEPKVSYTRYRITSTQTQSWYGDDPASPFDDTGSSQAGIPYIIRSDQFSLGLSFTLTL